MMVLLIILPLFGTKVSAPFAKKRQKSEVGEPRKTGASVDTLYDLAGTPPGTRPPRVAGLGLYFTDHLKCIGLPFHTEQPVEEVVEEAAEAAEQAVEEAAAAAEAEEVPVEEGAEG